MKKDYSSYKYIAVEEKGDNVDIVMGIFSKIDKTVKWFFRSHIISDGIGTLTDRLKMDNIKLKNRPETKPGKIPSFFRRILLFLLFMKITRPIKYPWKNIDTSKKGPGAGIGYAIFSEEETRKLIEYCREQDVTLTSFVLQTLDRVTSNHLLNNSNKRLWHVPVNIRDNITDEESGNFTSSIAFHITDDSSIKSINNNLHTLYKKGLQYGSWIYSRAGMFFGLKGLRLILKFYKSPFFGYCSNMGNWDADIPEGHKFENSKYFFAGPVTQMIPVTTVIISWRGELSFTLHIHPSLTDDIENIDEMLRECVEKLCSHAKIEISPNEDNVIIKVVPREEYASEAERF